MVVAALIATVVLFVVARVFVPSREALGLAIVLVGAGAVGAAVAVLSLGPFFAGETLASTASVNGYLGTVAATGILFAVIGAVGYRSWRKRQSNRRIQTNAHVGGARG